MQSEGFYDMFVILDQIELIAWLIFWKVYKYIE
jgi:hypothetical protein